MAFDDAFLSPLKQLETAREALHAALRHAAFQFSVTQRMEEQRGHLLSFAAVPAAPDTLRPAFCVERVVDSDENNEEEQYWRLVKELNSPSSSPPSQPGAGADNNGTVVQSQEESEDLMPYVSARPSHDLRECQRLYQEALRCAVAVMNAQEEALNAAALTNSSPSG